MAYGDSTTGGDLTPGSELLEFLLQAGDIAVCVKDSNNKVLMQNDCCRRVCGDRVGETCDQGCMDLYARDHLQQWKNWGSRVYPNSLVHGSPFDVTLLATSDHIVTFLQPLGEKYDAALAYYRQKGLTRRETEVISLAIRGVSNAEICKRLSISKATLRTHLNNIYNRLRESGDIPEFIPAHRISG